MSTQIARRMVPALVVVVALLLGPAAPMTARGATVTCPEHTLLSEELARTPSVFVGTVQGTFEREERGAVIQVEEIWHGPPLARVVRVTIDDATGAPLLDLRTGNRYLVAAEPLREVADADTRVDALFIRACGVTRPLTPELAGLRPSDARELGPPAPAAEMSSSGAPWWLWLVATLLITASAAIRLSGSPGDRRRRLTHVSLLLGGASLAAFVVAAVLSLPAGHLPGETASPSRPAAASPRLPGPTAADGPQVDSALVVRLEVMTHAGATQTVSVHADGRFITSALEGNWPILREQRLTIEGVRLVRDAVAATGRFGPDAPAEAHFLPQPLPGIELASRGGFSETLTAGSGDEATRVTWTPIDEEEAHLFADAPEIERLEELARQLLAAGSWLPQAAWADPEPRPYRAVGFTITARTLPLGANRPSIDLGELAWPLPVALAELPATPDLLGQPVRCAQLSRSQAAALLASIGERFGLADLTLASAATDVVVDDAVQGLSYGLQLRPLLPDERGCQPPSTADPPSAELAPGAIAVVRVDALRVRPEPGTRHGATDAFRSGELVAIVSGPVSADGMDWYDVRQGPGGRGGFVAGGPDGGDPWLVAVGNGSIVFLGMDGTGRTTIERVEPDGSGHMTLLDGSAATWSPDGGRLVLTLPPGRAEDSGQIATAAPDGSLLTVLGPGEYPAWSPDGSRIAFGRGLDLYVMRADGQEVELLATEVPPWTIAWAPDSSRIAFTRAEGTPPGRGEGVVLLPEALWVVDLATLEETQLTAALFDSGARPAWSPDGTHLTYGGNRLVTATGADVLRLEAGSGWADASPWSPDGNELALVSADGSIEILDVATGSRRIVVASARAVAHLAWSPDGRQLAYASHQPSGDAWSVHVVDVVGGRPIEIGPPYSQFPAWQPVLAIGFD